MRVSEKFDGNCAEAMRHYQKCLKADLQLKLYPEVFGDRTPPPLHKRIMMARLTRGPAVLLGADIMPNPQFKNGNNFTISITCDSKQEVDDYVKALSQDGSVTMPGQAMPAGNYFGKVTDKYGIDWIFTA